MKSLTCDICGAKGMVHKVTGKDEKEVLNKMEKHIKDVHPTDYDNMMTMSDDDINKMMDESRKRIVDDGKAAMGGNKNMNKDVGSKDTKNKKWSGNKNQM
jgi:predicted small metal-binding protein